MTEAENGPIRQSQLHGRLVIDIETTEELGNLTQFVVDVQHHQVEGFLCRKGLLSLSSTPVMWVQVESVGQDSILVRRSGNVISERFDEGLVLESQAIWSDSGNNVATLVDYRLDLTTGAITQYVFAFPGWQGLTEGLYTFQPEAVVSAGKKRIMVRQTALDNAPQFVPGIQDRVVDALHQDVRQTRQDVKGAVDGAREVAGQAQEQARKLGEQAKTQFGQVFGQVRQRSKQLRSQVNDRFADAASNLQNPPNSPQPKVPGTTIDVDSEEIWPDEDA
ncbi:hypothetical protein PN498_22965 [Oscillatoria sp. CS-180]|uniref:PRC-barrel domain-containing protein n=1 Tax=Oscillatoria sp. CS-180 TaxID=3021720 RepID=UPI00232ABD87|nr:hypothetical protein [Oscillatoria sp. CS-180]MDB9528873.1 hypothetical protein [Oscillatoria sp. CS-180]